MTQPQPAPIAYTEDDRKYLEMLQAVITRLANNSFLLKGWAITLAIAVVSLNKSKFSYEKLSLLIPILLFAFLDAYFLNSERNYRNIFEKARNHSVPLYSFKLDPFKFRSYSKAVFSQSILPFYLILIIFTGITLYISK